MILLTFILICYGICNNLIYGSIFQGFRDFLKHFGTGGYSIHKLFSCFMCLGTWMGFAVSLVFNYFGYLGLTPIGSLGITNLYLVVILNGFISTAGVWLIHTLQEALERAFEKE